MFYPLTAPAPRDQPGGFSLQHSQGPGQARGEGGKVWGGDDLRVMREYDENIAVKERSNVVIFVTGNISKYTFGSK